MESQTANNLTQKLTPRPGFFYGYIIVLVSFIIVMMGWGVFYIYGVFFTPLTDEFGWSRAVTSAAYSLCVLVSGVLGIVAGRLSDSFGPKKVIVVCAVFLGFGCALMALVHSVWQFYVLYGLVIATGICGSWSPPLAAVAHWFVGRRGLMTGIVTGGISIGTLIMAPVVTHWITLFGWRISYIILGGVILVIMVVSAQFLKLSPHQMGLKAYGETENKSVILPLTGFSLTEAIHTRSFWLACAIYFCFGFAHFSIMVHIVPEATGKGISPINAAVILSIIGITGMAGRLVLGGMTDRLKVKEATTISLFLIAVGLLWLQLANNMWMLYAFAFVFGFGYGGISCLQSLLAAEFFGLTSIGVITSIFSLSVNLGGAIGPVLAGFLFDVSGAYRGAFLICAAVIILAVIISFSLKAPKK